MAKKSKTKKKRTTKKKSVKKKPVKRKLAPRRKPKAAKPIKKSTGSRPLTHEDVGWGSPSRRHFPRVPLKIKIDYFKDPGVFLYDYSRNLGRGGIFIETRDPLPPGTEINLNFTLPAQSEPVEVKGKVAWVLKPDPKKRTESVPGMGIQFDNPAGENKEKLDRFFREVDYDNLNF